MMVGRKIENQVEFMELESLFSQDIRLFSNNIISNFLNEERISRHLSNGNRDNIKYYGQKIGFPDTMKTHSKKQQQQQHQNLHAAVAPYNNNTNNPSSARNSSHISNNSSSSSNVGDNNNGHTAGLSSLMNMAFMHPLSFAVLQAQIHQNPMTAVAAASLVPSMYNPHFIPAWPQSASSPPTILPTGPISPTSNNNNNNNNNSNLNKNLANGLDGSNNSSTHSNSHHRISPYQSTSSMDRLTSKKKLTTEMKKRVGATLRNNKSNDGGDTISVGSSASSSGSPEGVKDTTTRDKVFTCTVCNRSFGYKHVLQNHERTHTGEKPFECKECHKKFTRDHHLKTHMRLHTGEKPYSCTHCDRQFVQVANLRRHLRVHTGERPYTCEICNGKFSDSNQLKAHLLIHKDEKPFDCKQCLQRFRRKHHFVQHKCSNSVNNPAPNNVIANNNNNNSSPRSSPMMINEAAANDESRGSLVNENDSEMPLHAHQQPHRQQRQEEQSEAVPLNLTYSVDAPVQTEPEDLSMPSSRSRNEASRPASRALSDCADRPSPMSQSNSEAEDEDEPELQQPIKQEQEQEQEQQQQQQQEEEEQQQQQSTNCSSQYGIASSPSDR